MKAHVWVVERRTILGDWYADGGWYKTRDEARQRARNVSCSWLQARVRKYVREEPGK